MTTITRTNSGGVSVEIIVDDDRLRQIAQEAGGGPIMLAVQKTAFDIERTAKSEGFVPVDTGFLANSIQAQQAQVDGTTVYADIAVFAEYGIYVEEGHLTRAGGEGWVGAQNYVPGKHFMRRALDQEAPKLAQALQLYFDKAGT